MKILHVTPPDVNNGVYRYIFNHMRYMDCRRFRHAFLTKGVRELKQTPEYEKYGFEVYELKGAQRDDAGKFRQEIIQILGNGFDVVHLHTSSWRGFMIEEIAMELHIPRVIVHSHSTGIDAGSLGEREERIREHNAFKQQFSMKHATDVWACSKLAADWLYGAAVPQNRIRIMPNAIETERYRYNPIKREQFRAVLGLTDKFVVGNIGRYTFQKNQEFLIRAFADACEKNDRMYLLCLGEGEQGQYLRKLIAELGIADRACCMEWQENVEDYLQVMDVFCLPSRFEGFPISVVEAQAAGLSCLVADTVTEEIKLTNRVHFLPLEKERWAEALLKCNTDVQRTGWDEEVARAGYNVRHAAKKLENMYEGKENRIYIFGAHSRARTLAAYLQYLYPELEIEAFLYDNDEPNALKLGNVPVFRWNPCASLHADYPIYIGTRGIYHRQIAERLREAGFRDIRPVTVELDRELRNAYLEKYYAVIGRKFLKMDKLEDAVVQKAPFPAACKIYVAKSVHDSVLQMPYKLLPYEQEIQVGAAMTEKRLAQEILTDDTGDNISGRNRQFCELTALYWIWKNAKEDIVGLAHYRRHFILPADWVDKMQYGLADVILPVPLYAAPNLADDFKKRHGTRVWECMMQCIKEYDAEMYEEADRFFRGNLYSPCNMLIVRRTILDELCGWLFPILFRVAEQIGEEQDNYQNRYPGFLSERLISFFFEKNKERYKVVYADKNFLC